MKKKIIISTIIVSILLAVGVATLILGLIPVGINDKINRPDEIFIYCKETNVLPYHRLTLQGRDEQESEKLNKIFDKFNVSFQQKALKALFNGEINNKIEENSLTVSTTMSKNYSSLDKITMVFYYENAQTITINGQAQNYNYLFFELSNENAWQENILGVSVNLPSDEENIGTINYKNLFKAKGNLSEVYECAKSFINEY